MKRKRSYSGSKRKSYGPYSAPFYKKARYAVYKSPRLAWPQEYVTTLRFIACGIINSAGTSTNALRLTSNAFDIDPALGGTTMPGFDQYAGLYQRFRTLSMSYDVELMNIEAFNMLGYTGFTNDSSAVVSHQNCGNPLWKIGTMGPLTGFNKLKLKDSKTLVQIVGTRQPLVDDIFTGSTTSSTLSAAGTVSLWIAVESPSAVIIPNGCNYKVTLDVMIQFYKKQQINV